MSGFLFAFLFRPTCASCGTTFISPSEARNVATVKLLCLRVWLGCAVLNECMDVYKKRTLYTCRITTSADDDESDDAVAIASLAGSLPVHRHRHSQASSRCMFASNV